MCYNPIKIKTDEGYKEVPCGRCLACLAKYQSDWSNRMYEELRAHKGKAVFFTLTYDDQSVPKNYLYYGTTDIELEGITRGNCLSGETPYVLFRSPSNYRYSNIYTDEKGKERVVASYGRENRKTAVSPDVQLHEAGLDNHPVLDFNIKRENHKKFIEQVHRIYGDFIRTVDDLRPVDSEPTDYLCPDRDSAYDFDCTSIGDFDVQDDLQFLNEMLADVTEDCDYDAGLSPIIQSRLDSRPIMMFNSVRKKDVQDWLKRGREKLRRSGIKDLTYFVTSEYGPRTLRPHYHGILFGVTAAESAFMKLDWQKRFGDRVQWEDVDLGKGDMSYCAKYCSKSFYEHPLCSRDFFYSRAVKTTDGVEVMPFSEYHSKRYERCIELFDIDAPIVDRTFHLISKGFGLSWIDENKDRFYEGFDDDLLTPDEPTFTTRTIAPWDDDFTTWTMKGYKPDDDGFLTVEIPVTDKLIINTKPERYEKFIQRLFDRFHYYRNFKSEVYSYGVPKYYRSKVFSDTLRRAFANYVSQVNVEVYQQKLDSIRAGNPDWTDAQVVSEIASQERRSNSALASRYFKKMEKTFNKSKI